MTLTLVSTDVTVACRLARQAQDRGDYGRAAAHIKVFWSGLGKPPELNGLTDDVRAEALFLIGTLTSRLGSARQFEGAQSQARMYLGAASRLFDDPSKVAECENAIATTYWREGDFNTASVVAREALSTSPNGSPGRAALINTLALVELQQGHLREAYDLLLNSYEEVESAESILERAHFHNNFGLVKRRLAESEGNAELYDSALIEYAGAQSLYGRCGNDIFRARVENNMAWVCIYIGQPERAHPYIQSAISIAKAAKDYSLLGSFEETRARAFLGEGELSKALVAINSSLAYLSDGDELALQAESQTTLGIVHARMGNLLEADAAFRRAAELAEMAQISTAEIRLAYLREMVELHKGEALKLEKELVQLALDTSEGHPSHAAKLLGISHQNMINKIRRFKLEAARTPAQPRRRKAHQ